MLLAVFFLPSPPLWGGKCQRTKATQRTQRLKAPAGRLGPSRPWRPWDFTPSPTPDPGPRGAITRSVRFPNLRRTDRVQEILRIAVVERERARHLEQAARVRLRLAPGQVNQHDTGHLRHLAIPAA